MENLIPVLVIIGVLGTVAFGFLFIAHKDQSHEDSHVTPLKSFASRNGYTFEKYNSSINLAMARAKFSLGYRQLAQNIFSKNLPTATIRILDSTYARKYNAPRLFNAVCVLVEFKHRRFPLFELDHANSTGNLLELGRYPKISPEHLPKWANESLTIRTLRDFDEAVIDLLSDKSELLNLFRHPMPRRMYANKNMIALYFGGTLRHDKTSLKRFESIAIQIIEVFGNHT